MNNNVQVNGTKKMLSSLENIKLLNKAHKTLIHNIRNILDQKLMNYERMTRTRGSLSVLQKEFVLACTINNSDVGVQTKSPSVMLLGFRRLFKTKDSIMKG